MSLVLILQCSKYSSLFSKSAPCHDPCVGCATVPCKWLYLVNYRLLTGLVSRRCTGLATALEKADAMLRRSYNSVKKFPDSFIKSGIET